jgi:hydroxymethylpyrimidine pyrophosphatase-like HAD family hydrolase
MQHFIFVDLDDTLFQTLRKCGGAAANPQENGLTPRAFLKNGAPISYSTRKQDHLWQWLVKAGHVIPVTARNYDAYSRVDLRFPADAVLNHGAVIVNEHHRIDLEWQAQMAQLLPPYHHELIDLWGQVQFHAQKDPALQPRLVEDFGVIWYGVVKHADASEAALRALHDTLIIKHEAVACGRLYCHINGNNLAVLPRVVGKAHAVGFLLERYARRYDALLTVGIGDSKTDSPFMALCDYAMIPGNTQLGELFRDL